MRKGIYILVVAAVFGCVKLPPSPQTTGELKALYNGENSEHALEFDSKMKYNDLLVYIERKSNECIAKTRNNSIQGGMYGERSTVSYRPSLTKLKGDFFEYTVQYYTSPSHSSMPPDGYFLMLADIKKIKDNKAHVTFYGGKQDTPFSEILRATENWLRGEKAECPKMPGI